MPVYEYRCEACTGTFEVLTRFAEREAQVCPLCESKQIRVLVSSFAYSGERASGLESSSVSSSSSCCGGGCGSCGCAD